MAFGMEMGWKALESHQSLLGGGHFPLNSAGKKSEAFHASSLQRHTLGTPMETIGMKCLWP